MNTPSTGRHRFGTYAGPRRALLAASILFALSGVATVSLAATAPEVNSSSTAPMRAVDDDDRNGPALGPTLNLVTGKSTLLRLAAPVDRISVGNPTVADVTVIGPRQLYILGKTFGSTNIILWRKSGLTSVVDVVVNIDGGLLQSKLAELMPDEKGIQVHAAADSVVLSGVVSSSAKVEQAVAVAEAYVRNINKGLVMPIVAGNKSAQEGTAVNITQASANTVGGAVVAAGARVVNLLQVSSPQQVMLEVKIAEVSKTLLDKLGAQFGYSRTNGSWTYALLGDFLSGGHGIYTAVSGVRKALTIDAEKQDGLVKVLAEPNIVAISGQEGSFLAGGKIFIPVARDNGTGGTTITLEEKEFGVGLKFTPTVLDGGRINLRVSPEVSELSQTGSPFTTVNGTTAVLPSFTTRKAQTTVQLGDGQSFAIAGLIKNNVTETIKRFPILGEVPVLGALFRSSEFQQEKTELVFLVTPRLIKPQMGEVPLPTDNFVPPDRSQFFLGGKLEGTAEEHKPTAQPVKTTAEPEPEPAKDGTGTTGGFELK